MKLLAGLGNPSAKHANNRHNVGFMAVDAIAGAQDFSPWRSRFHGEYAEGTLSGDKVILLKPATYMNNSGQSVGEALRFYKLAPTDVIVVHDELDLDPGKCRFKSGGGHAGHNGLRSIHQHIGETYHRLRIGIGHPGDKNMVSAYVLHDFAKSDRDWLAPLLQRIAKAAPLLISGDQGRFANAIAPLFEAKDKPTKIALEPALEEPSGARNALQRLIDRFL